MREHDFADDFWESKEDDFIDVEEPIVVPNVSEEFLEATQDISTLLGKVSNDNEQKKEEVKLEENGNNDGINNTSSSDNTYTNYNQVDNPMNDLTELNNSVVENHIENLKNDSTYINNMSSLSDLKMKPVEQQEENDDKEDSALVSKSQEISPKLKKMFKEDDALAKKEVEELDVRNDFKVGIIMLGIFLLFIIVLPLIFDAFK